MKTFRSFAALMTLSSLIGPGLLAQEAGVPPLVETVDIRVINIDAVVTDKKGNPIRGLKAADFDVYENGRPQAITNFYEVTAASVQTAPQTAGSQANVDDEVPAHLRRRIVFYIDNLSLAPFNRNRVFTSMKKFAKEVMRPGDEAMIATWNRSMKIRVPFTSDATQIDQALSAIAGESALGLQSISERRSVEGRIRDTNSYEEAVIMARQYAQSIEHDLRQSVTALSGLMSTLAGVEGKKILVLTSEGFPIQPGREMFYFIEDIRREKSEWQGYGSSMLEGLGFEAGSLIQSVAKAANANGITLYTLHAGGLLGMSENSAEHQAPVSFGVQQAAITNSTDSLHLMADMTGGLAAIGTNNFESAFSRIGKDLQSYYSIGYRSGTERVDRQRNVEVRVRNKNYVVRSRRTFVEKSISTEMTDKVIANLFYPLSTNDLKITITTGRPEPLENGHFKVPLEIHIPVDNLTFIPQGEIIAGGFSVFLVVGNKDDDMSDVSRQQQQIRLKPSEHEALKGRNYIYAVELIMERGRNRISVGIVDDVGNVTGFDRREVLAMDLR